ncbi:MAG: DUF6062 family protein [Atribacterota bacterium]
MDRIFYDLQNAVSQPGCPFCKIEKDTTRRYLDTLFYELINDPAIRKKIIFGGGFCPAHTELVFEERNSILGIAILYQDLLSHYFEDQKTASGCPLCQALKEKEHHLLTILRKRWAELKPLWGERTFLCTRHLVSIQNEGKLTEEIGRLTQNALHTIQQSLSGLIEKFDYRKSRLPVQEKEALSWQETLEFFAGKSLKKERK